MSAGITKVHGTVVAPSQRPSTLSFFQIDFGVDMTAEVGLVNGALEKAIVALSEFATIGMIGTLNATGGTGQGLRIAIEDTGTDAYSPSYLGTGPTNGAGSAPDNTAAALTAALVALGADVGPNSIDLTGAVVTAFAL
jgi:hypothetical protein